MHIHVPAKRRQACDVISQVEICKSINESVFTTNGFYPTVTNFSNLISRVLLSPEQGWMGKYNDRKWSSMENKTLNSIQT